MRLEIRFAGFGGQGVILASVILGKTVIFEGKEAIQNEVYGPEKRGSLLRSDIIITDGAKIHHSVIDKADILVVMSESALEAHKNNIKKEGLVIIDSQMIKNRELLKGLNVVEIPAREIAEKVGSSLTTNMVILGYLCKLKNIVKLESLLGVLETSVKKKYVELNKKAIEEGYNFKKED